MKTLYIIAGPNGAGKTTASFSILPEIFNCKEFVNADEIARGISPFNPEKVAFHAGRIMLMRINELLEEDNSFAFETTLATKSFVKFIEKAKQKGFEVILLFLQLSSEELAIQRVKTRVEEGGHNIPKQVIKRRFKNGLSNLFNLYIPKVDKWIIVDNSEESFLYIANGSKTKLFIKNIKIWNKLKQGYGN